MKKPAGKGGRKHLHDDEQQLWEIAAHSIEPLRRRKQRVHTADTAETADPAVARTTRATDAARTSPPAAGKTSAAAAKTQAPASKATARPSPPIADFDRKKARKIRSGQVDIEARIDLHGMRQDEAHAALVAFLRRCHGKGQRWVLVITGKGKASDDDRDAPFDMTRDRGRGVLKRNVPRWLEEPDLRAIVVSFTVAGIGHGGEGALYVHLRTKR